MQSDEANVHWTVLAESMVIGIILTGVLAMAVIAIASQFGF
jgi:hypothetical protein